MYSSQMVRMEAAETLEVLNLYGRAADTVIKRLSDTDPTVRAHAVTSLVSWTCTCNILILV